MASPMSGTPSERPAATFPDPSSIVRLSTAYWESQALLTANRLRLFDVLAEGACSAEEVAVRLHLDPRGAALFLRACVGLGLLQEPEGHPGLAAVHADRGAPLVVPLEAERLVVRGALRAVVVQAIRGDRDVEPRPRREG